MTVKFILDEEVKTSFKALSLALQVLGLYVPPGRRLCQSVAQWMYSLTLLVFTWTNGIRFYFIFKSGEGSSQSLLTKLSIFNFYLFSAYLSPAVLYASTKHMDSFLKELSDYKKHFGLASNLEKVKVWVVIFLSTLCIYGFSAVLVNILYFTIFTSPLMNELSVPFSKMEGISRIFGMTFVCVTNALSSVAFLLVMVFFSWCCYILRKEYDAVNKAVMQMVADKNADMKCEAIRQQHVILTRILDKSNCMITHFLFYLNAVWIPVICFLLYGLVRGGQTIEEFMTALFIATAGISTLFAATLMSADLSIKAHGYLDDLLRLDMSELSPKTLQIVSIFSNRVAGPTIGFSVYGLFTVDGTAVLTIIGTLLTYAVIVLQLKPEDIAPVDADANTFSFQNT